MQDLSIKRDLSNEEYHLGDVPMAGILVSVWRTPTEVIITDSQDHTKIYQITSVEFQDKAFGG